MLNCAEQVQMQKYKTHAYMTPKTAGVQTIMLKHRVLPDFLRTSVCAGVPYRCVREKERVRWYGIVSVV